MNAEFLHHYNVELAHLREMGAEFADEYPKIAARLRLDGVEVADPYVERLLEGFAFLAARIQLKLDAEFPRFTQRVLDILHPQYLAPIPAMLIARFEPQAGETALQQGATVERGSMLRSAVVRKGSAACQFRTAHDVVLWPIELAAASYFMHAAKLDLATLPQWRSYGGGIRLRLRASGGATFSQIDCDSLRFFCSGPDESAFRLHELICGQTIGIVLRSSDGRSALLDAKAVVPVGFDDAHAALPVSRRGFNGFRLLQEYFAFPQRFLFFDIEGLREALRGLDGDEIEMSILLARGDGALAQTVDANALALYCTPAVNLFEHRCDRIHVNSGSEGFQIVPDRTHPLDFEVVDVLEVVGHSGSLDSERRFLPLYSASHDDDARPGAYFSTMREPRRLSSIARRDGSRSVYIGSEVTISIVDQDEAPYSSELKQLAVKALCSNRDLPLSMATADGGTMLSLQLGAPVTSIEVVRGPSRPLAPLRQGHLAWQLIGQFTLNHIGLDIDQGSGPGADKPKAAARLRDVLKLYVQADDAALLRQIEGIVAVTSRPVVRRLAMPGPIAFGRGVQIDLELDESAFQGGSAFLFGNVLARFFARQVSINSYTLTRVRSTSRGEIYAGPPLVGTRPLL